MRDKYYFISDIHLGIRSSKEFNKFQELLLIDFLNEIQSDAKELFIIGDLFDCWIEYKRVVPKGYYKLFTKISELTEAGVKITYFAGNHDFWRGKYFKEEFGIEIEHTGKSLEIDGKKFFLNHGDGLAYNDTGYRILKKILRSPVSQKLYSLLHPNFGIWLATSSSASSREYTSKKDWSGKDGLRDFALNKLDEGYDYVVMGHRHLPIVIEKNKQKYYINLGDWIRNFTYGVFKDGNFRLMKYYDYDSKKVVNTDYKKNNDKKE